MVFKKYHSLLMIKEWRLLNRQQHIKTIEAENVMNIISRMTRQMLEHQKEHEVLVWPHL